MRYYFMFALIFIFFALVDADEQGNFSYEIPCGIPNQKENLGDKVINGEIAKPHEFPWMISIQVLIKGRYLANCGGSIIHSEFVLTAGHCLQDFDKKELRLAAGKVNINNEEESEQYRFVKRTFYAGYDDDNYKNDIALAQVNESFILNPKTVAPICLPTGGQNFYDMRLSAGWGVTEEAGVASNELMKVMLPAYDTTKCKNTYADEGYDYYLHDCQVCTLEPGKDVCQGDSGGPLMCGEENDNKLYCCGINSWGAGCARKEFPGVYTDVLCFTDWIKDTVKQNKNK